METGRSDEQDRAAGGRAHGRSEDPERGLADLLPQVVFEADLDGNLVFANRHAFEAFGYSEEDFRRGINILQTITPEDRARARENVQRVLRGETLHGTEYTALRKDGTTFPVLIYSAPVLRDQRTTGLRGILVDIAERTRAEVAIREGEEKYRLLFEMESDAIFLIDNAEGRILEVNPAASTLYGYSRDELLARRNVDLSAEPAETRAATAMHRPRVPVRLHRKKNGMVFPVEITARHLVWNGREAHIAAIRDIAERLEAQEAVRYHRQSRWLDVRWPLKGA